MESIIRSLIYAVLLLFGLVILSMLGIIEASFYLIISFVMSLYGLMSFVMLSGTRKTGTQLISAVIFYMGIVLFISEYGYYGIGTEHYIPALFGIGAFSCLMVYLEEGSKPVHGITGASLLLAGILYYYFFGETGLHGVFRLIIKLMREIWMLLLVLLIFIFYSIEKNR